MVIFFFFLDPFFFFSFVFMIPIMKLVCGGRHLNRNLFGSVCSCNHRIELIVALTANCFWSGLGLPLSVFFFFFESRFFSLNFFVRNSLQKEGRNNNNKIVCHNGEIHKF